MRGGEQAATRGADAIRAGEEAQAGAGPAKGPGGGVGSRQAVRGGLGAPNGHAERNAGPWTARVRRPVSLYIRSETALPLPARRRLRVLHAYEGHSPVLTILNSPP